MFQGGQGRGFQGWSQNERQAGNSLIGKTSIARFDSKKEKKEENERQAGNSLIDKTSIAVARFDSAFPPR